MGKGAVAIGMSGGVDSSVAAYLLKKAGYDVIGITMQTWKDGENEQDGRDISVIADARRVAEYLNIPHYVVDFHQEFHEKVENYFVSEYLAGRTPNPCVMCNRYVKWEALLSRANQLGADCIATGHYARIEKLTNGRYTLKKSVTAGKDQTYALYQLTQSQLAHTLVPIGEYAKEDIRKIADEVGIPVADKPDSQEICFIPDHDYAAFIERTTGKTVPPGQFVDTQGRVIGRHRGITHYTVGQRKGLGLAMGQPVFVSQIRPNTNEVVIGSNRDIMSDTLYADGLNFMSVPDLTERREVIAKIRYNHAGSPCVIEKTKDDVVKCVFTEPQRAITPGQAVVFYENDYVLGGGTIL